MLRFVRLLSLPLIVWGSTILASGQVNFSQVLYSGEPDETPTHALVAADFNRDGILDLAEGHDGFLVFYKGVGGASSPLTVSCRR